jgi:hypothetical protein
MLPLLARLLPLILCLAASGCVDTIRTTITIHHTLPDRMKGVAYAFVPFKDQEENPENLSYRNMIRDSLGRYRFRETDAEHASIILSFSYGIDEGEERRDRGVFRERVWTEYRKSLWVFLYEKAPEEGGEKTVVYEGSVVCAGPLSLLGNVMPLMVRELFFDFPGASGTKRTVLLAP